MRLGLLVAAAVFALDQIVKLALLDVLRGHPGGIELTPFFNLVTVWNRGISFGLFGDGGAVQRWLLVGLALVVAAGLVWWLRQGANRLAAAGIGAIVGGALGNALDRLVYGAVADFFDLHLAGYHWPAFNIADSAIVVGVAVLLIDSLFIHPERR